jgi:hypothetical protein
MTPGSRLASMEIEESVTSSDPGSLDGGGILSRLVVFTAASLYADSPEPRGVSGGRCCL